MGRSEDEVHDKQAGQKGLAKLVESDSVVLGKWRGPKAGSKVNGGQNRQDHQNGILVVKQRRGVTSRLMEHIIISFLLTTTRREFTKPKRISVSAFVQVGQRGKDETSLENALKDEIGYFENDSRKYAERACSSTSEDDNVTAVATTDCKENGDEEEQRVYFKGKGLHSGVKVNEKMRRRG